jgi:hypothetical protein
MFGLWLMFLAACGIEYNLVSLIDAPRIFVQDNRATEAFKQPDNSKVDILFVIDNSGSMSPYQEQLVASITPFMDAILQAKRDKNIDFHIGVVTTDMGDSWVGSPEEAGVLRGVEYANGGSRTEIYYISDEILRTYEGVSATSNYALYRQAAIDMFSVLAVAGADGSSSERGRDAAYTALEVLKDKDSDGDGTIEPFETGVNSGFRRDDANLAIVVLSDEIDSSTTISQGDWIDWLNSTKTSEVTSTDSHGNVTTRGQSIAVSISSIVGIKDSSVQYCSGDGQNGVSYTDVTDAVGGESVAICQSDWTLALSSISTQALGLGFEFVLQFPAVADSIEVYVKEKNGREKTYSAPSSAFTYDASRKTVIFNSGYVPGYGAQISISYEVLEDDTGTP